MLRCPRCFGLMGSLRDNDGIALDCSTCKSRLACEHGIWKALTPERLARYARFVDNYESIRASEGRGSTSADYYLALPYRDLSGRLGSQWAIRGRTFRYIERKILPRIAALTHHPLRILDLGAGNGWMSYRLARQGHAPVAVDLLTNDRDGLGAAQHCSSDWALRFRAFRRKSTICPWQTPSLIWRSLTLRFIIPRTTKDIGRSASLRTQRGNSAHR